MRHVQSLRHRDREGQRRFERQLAAAEALLHRFALQMLEDEEIAAIMRAEVVNGADAGMAQPRDGFGFALQPRARGRRERRLGGDDLDRHDPIEQRVAGGVDFPHTARAERAEDLVAAESIAGITRHLRTA